MDSGRDVRGREEDPVEDDGYRLLTLLQPVFCIKAKSFAMESYRSPVRDRWHALQSGRAPRGHGYHVEFRGMDGPADLFNVENLVSGVKADVRMRKQCPVGGSALGLGKAGGIERALHEYPV